MKQRVNLAAVAVLLGLLPAVAGADVSHEPETIDPAGRVHSASIDDLIAVEARVRDVLERASLSTVLVDGSGSGVIISEDGYVLTAAHVNGAPGQDISIRLHDGTRVTGETLGSFRLADAGLIRIKEPGPYHHVSMAAPETVNAGDWCFALGHPGGWQSDRGVVLRIGKVLAAGRHMVMTDCKLLGGDSGGPLFNLRGEVIGIHSRIGEGVEENYHAPIGAFSGHWDALVSGRVFPERFRRNGGFLGVKSDSHPDGVIVREIVAASAAEAAALRVGDIITHIDDAPLHHQWDLSRLIGRHHPGTDVELRIVRDGHEETITATLGSRNAD